MNAPKCPACQGPKPARLYLCRGCWFTLQPRARAALNRRDDLAVTRLRELYDQIQRGIPLREVVITS
ncbi:MAG: hypothetical protein ACRDP6_48880 [Actinoallomurus sp.]